MNEKKMEDWKLNELKKILRSEVAKKGAFKTEGLMTTILTVGILYSDENLMQDPFCVLDWVNIGTKKIRDECEEMHYKADRLLHCETLEEWERIRGENDLHKM
jgi:hypothetical protein